MVTQRMGSEQNPSRIEPKSNPLIREGTMYNLTLDEVQNQLGDLGKPFTSMNLDELLKTLWTVEGHNQSMEGVDFGQSVAHQPGPGSSLNQPANVNLSTDLSKKTVNEVLQNIQQEQSSGLDRKETLGEMTLEDFLAKAGVVAESTGSRTLGSTLGAVDPIGMPQQGPWMNYPNPSIHPQQGMMPVYAPGHPIQPPIPLSGNPILDSTVYPETQAAVSSPPLVSALSDTQSPGQKRGPPDDFSERSVERRQKRMIKNRESAARSRARKQAYTHELENKVLRLEEENERLKKLQELEKALPSVPPPEPRFQLRRTSSAPM